MQGQRSGLGLRSHADVNGDDAAVTGSRISPIGSFETGNGQFALEFRVRIK